jgi:hypothetical protein
VDQSVGLAIVVTRGSDTSNSRLAPEETMRFAIAVITTWLLFVCAAPAYAYVDPGTGSMMIQLLLGGFAGLAVFARLSWNRLRATLQLRKNDQDRTA